MQRRTEKSSDRDLRQGQSQLHRNDRRTRLLEHEEAHALTEKYKRTGGHAHAQGEEAGRVLRTAVPRGCRPLPRIRKELRENRQTPPVPLTIRDSPAFRVRNFDAGSRSPPLA